MYEIADLLLRALGLDASMLVVAMLPRDNSSI